MSLTDCSIKAIYVGCNFALLIMSVTHFGRLEGKGTSTERTGVLNPDLNLTLCRCKAETFNQLILTSRRETRRSFSEVIRHNRGGRVK